MITTGSQPLPAQEGPLVRVRLFAGLREAMGWSELSVPAAAGATPLGLWHQLGLGEGWRGADGGGGGAVAALPHDIRVAINQHFAAADTPLAAGDELAFLPPISGG
jgi:molybdopterin synthase sulfur carrier subunit